jgi:hypothetical protein
MLRLFDKMSRICSVKRKKVIGEWRKLQSNALLNLYSLPNINMVKRWMGYVARTREMLMKRRDHLEDLGVVGKIVLKCMLQKIVCEGVNWIQLA